MNVTRDAVFDIKLFYSSETNRNGKCELDTGFFILTLDQVINEDKKIYHHNNVTDITETYFYINKSVHETILLTKGQYIIIPVSFRLWRYQTKSFNLNMHSLEEFSVFEEKYNFSLLSETIIKRSYDVYDFLQYDDKTTKKKF